MQYTLKTGEVITVTFSPSDSDNRYVEADFEFSYLDETGWGKVKTDEVTDNLVAEADFFSHNVDIESVFEDEDISFEEMIIDLYLESI
jgi:hypothetical protein